MTRTATRNNKLLVICNDISDFECECTVDSKQLKRTLVLKMFGALEYVTIKRFSYPPNCSILYKFSPLKF